MAQRMPLPLTVSCFSKIQIRFTFLVPAYPGSPGKGPLNGCVCCCADLAARLQRSVERLLDRLMDAGRRVQDGRQSDAELRQSLQRAEANVAELSARCDDLEQQLTQETQTREFLSVEFYKADGMLQILFPVQFSLAVFLCMHYECW